MDFPVGSIPTNNYKKKKANISKRLLKKKLKELRRIIPPKSYLEITRLAKESNETLVNVSLKNKIIDKEL